MIDPSWIAGLGVILFGVGLIGVFTRNNAIVVLMLSLIHISEPTRR